MASIIKRGSSWAVRVSYHDATGKRRQKNGTFKTKQAATYFANMYEQAKLEGADLLTSNRTFYDYFQEWFETYKAAKVAPATYRNYEFTLDKIGRHFGQQKIATISRARYQNFINHLAKSYSRETVAKIAGHCRACVSDAVDDGVIRRNFTTRTVIPQCTDYGTHNDNYLDLADMRKLRDYIMPKASIANISAVMILTGLLTGARYSEIAGLTWDDIDFQNQTIRIDKTLDYKGPGDFLPTKTQASNRTITIPPTLIKVLTTLQQDQVTCCLKNDLQLIFIGIHSPDVPNDNAVNKLLRAAHQKLGIKTITFHGLRHTHASYLIYKKISIW
ncbi:tyrosine-type recombinase/integrase [Lactiplantibacillus fabifermentans]|uniref:Prophage Lp2 protein 2, integrase n=1 Tax=Lactiplantibacillus fabifermentans DSM 21115 TaxID=1413187 RepID=A0A0R2NJZ6_9LACO|nr:site-specific integrase [Lactiplantibacillus fabifermentans]KRO26089.1 prophage Lp2 protein 2, integrase [Lactiplantibacillus fabifermentans DSM 21115]